MEGKLNLNNVIEIPASLTGSFFLYWIQFLSPLHKMTQREMELTAALLAKRYELSSNIINENTLDEYLMSKKVMCEIQKKCNLSFNHTKVLLNNLKKKKVLIDNKLNPKLIPKIKEGDFKLLLYFKLT